MASLPTFERLGAAPPKQVDAEAVGRAWTSTFSQHLSTRNVGGVMSLLHDDSWWRDLYAMTWDLRTFEGRPKIETFLHDRLDETGISAVSFRSAQFQQVYHDMAWTMVDFSFETQIGIGRGVSRLVYTKDGSWKAVIVCTILDGLKGHPELPRDQSDTHLDWDNERRKEQTFTDRDPEVLIIGSGHAGLAVAARLKHLGVSHLILEKNERVGDNWRNRYESLSLHSLTWAIHFPYLPFPTSWPAVIPAKKFATWLESYVEIFDLNVWTSSTATHASRDEVTGKWAVSVKRADGSERVMRVDHVVLAYGYPWKHSTWPGQNEFRGQILHSSQYRNAEGFRGKKVVVIGACTSGHDVARDCARLGVDVTLYQRSSTYVVSVNKGVRRIQPQHIWESGAPIEDIDVNFGHSIPNAFHKLMQNREEPDILELDKDILEPLREVGYRVRRFPDGPGLMFLSLGGGYYLDTGACKYIIEGKIKLKNDAQISRFEQDGIRFDNGSKLEADVIVVATGFTDNRVAASRLIGEELGSQLPPIWGINEEYEVNSVWRDLAPVAPNLWPMLGTIDWVRYYSKHVALQIKAKQVGLYGTRYAASDVPQKARL